MIITVFYNVCYISVIFWFKFYMKIKNVYLDVEFLRIPNYGSTHPLAFFLHRCHGQMRQW